MLTNSEKVAASRRKTKQQVVEAMGGKCIVCGYNKSAQVLQLHHKNPSEKEFGISNQGNTRSFARVISEARKCTLVCANCHAEIHAGITDISKFEQTFDEDYITREVTRRVNNQFESRFKSK